MSAWAASRTGCRRLVYAIALVAAPWAGASPFTETPPTSAGELAFAVAPVGGIVLDIVGANGNRISGQITADSLPGSANYNFSPVNLGTLGGFNDALTGQLGGGIGEMALRLTVSDWDNAAGELDFNAHSLRVNGIGFGNPSAAPAQATNDAGTPGGAGISAGGFRNNLLDTGWLLNTDAATLAAILAAIDAADQVTIDYTDASGNANVADFSRGVDAATAGLTLGPVLMVSLPNVARTPTQRQIAGTLEANAGAGNALDAARTTIVALGDAASQRAALDALAGRIAYMAGDSAIAAARAQGFNIDARIDDRRRGRAADGGRLTLALADDPLGVRDPWAWQVIDDQPGTANDASVAPAMPDDRRWRVFATGSLTFADSDASPGASSAQLGADTTTAGLTVGLDTRIDARTAVGIALGFAEADSDFDDGSTFDSQSVSLSLYATHSFNDRWHLDAAAAYTYADMSLDRRVVLPGINRTAEGDTHGHALSTQARLVYEAQAGPWTISPQTSVRYTDAVIDGYSESGGGGLGLSYDDQRARSLTWSLGATVERTWTWGRGRAVTPYAGVALEAELLDDARSIRTAFAGDPATPFVTFTDGPDDLYGRARAGLTTSLGGGWSAYADYSTLLAHEETEAHTVFGGLRYSF